MINVDKDFDKKIAKYAKRSIALDFASSFLNEERSQRLIGYTTSELDDKRKGIEIQCVPSDVNTLMRGYHWQGIIDIFQGNTSSGISMLSDENYMIAKVYKLAYWDFSCRTHNRPYSFMAPTYDLASMLSAYSMGQYDWFRYGMRWIDIYITEEVEVLNSDGLQGFMFSLQQSHQQQSWQVTGKESWYHQFFKSGLDLPGVVEQMLVYRMEKIDEVFSKRKQMACLFADSANSLYPFEVLAYIRLYNYIENTTIDIEHPYLEPFKNLTPLNKLQNKDLRKLDKLIDKKIEQIKKHGARHKN